MSDSAARRADFTSMETSSSDDWQIVGAEFLAFSQGLPDRILAHLRLLGGDFGGFKVDRLTH